MLIIATPKSASSAVVATLCEQHGLVNASESIRRGSLSRCPIPPDYAQLEGFHRREVAEIDDRVRAEVSAPGVLAKLHFPPTANNQSRLAATPKLILVRDAAEVLLAYKRGNEAGVFNLHHPAFCFCLSEEDWMQRARETGVLAELERFVTGWRAHAGEKLLVEWNELVGDPKATIARIEAYFGLPQSGATQLVRARYTRAPGSRRSVPGILFSRRKVIAKRLALDVAGLLGFSPRLGVPR